MNEELNEKAVILPPFKHFIMTVGEIPSSYLESMTYYEMLVWFTNYLGKTVVPAINENGEAVIELQNYVRDYFTNLDVQEEINNKLDAMAESGELDQLIKNYVDPLYQGYVDEINEEVESQNEEIAYIRNVVTNVSSGSPLVATSTDDMTDTSRIYVNTTDGKWYYYDGDSWEIGGDYQSSGIANNSIDILQLDAKLQSNFNLTYGNPLNLGNAYTGYYKKNGTLNTDSNFINYHYALENGKTYIFSGKSVSQAQSLLIMDNNDNVIFAINPNAQSHYDSYIFTVRDNNLTAYISVNTTIPQTVTKLDYYLAYLLRELTGIYNNLKYTTAIKKIYEIEGYYMRASVNHDTLTEYETGLTEIYEMNKGRTYKMVGQDWAAVSCVVILDLDRNVIYASSESNIGSTPSDVNYTYTAEVDGYIIMSSGNPTTYPYTIEIVEDGINIEIERNVLYGKKIGIDGDSIINGSGNSNTGYCDIIASTNNMTKSKRSVGGATIATGTYSGDTPRHYICESVSLLDSNCDYVIINGGFNDFGNDVPLGNWTNSYTAEVDSDTFYGGLETLCRNLLERFPNKKIAFCTNHNINNSLFNANTLGLTMSDYIEATYKVLNKYGIKIIDVGGNTHLNTAIAYFKNNFTDSADGVHPNANGYNYFYVDYITNEMKKL